MERWKLILLGVAGLLILSIPFFEVVDLFGRWGRVTISCSKIEWFGTFWVSQSPGGGVNRLPILSQEGIDIVIKGDVQLDVTQYHDGDRLTVDRSGRLVRQAWYQIVANDLAYYSFGFVRKVSTERSGPEWTGPCTLW